MNKWYVDYITEELQYDPIPLEEFGTEGEVIDFLNKWAKLDGFKFRVIKGVEVQFDPVTTVTSYKAVK